MAIKINWVLNKKLALGPAPRKKEDLNKLKNNQIKSILSLCSENEVNVEVNYEEDFYCNSTFMTYQNIIETFKLEVPTHVYIDAYGAEESIIKSITNSDTKFLPTKVMVDIEENVKKIEESEIFKMLKNRNYQLLSFQREKGISYLPDNLQSIFALKK